MAPCEVSSGQLFYISWQHTPLRQVLFEFGSNIPRIFHVKRCGRPKLDWFTESKKEAMHTMGWEAPTEITEQDLDIVIRAVNNRQGPF